MSIFAYVLIGIILYIIFTNKSLKEIYINIMAIFIFTYMHIEVGYFIKLGNTSVRFVWFLEIILIMFSIILLIKNKSMHKKILINGIAFFFTIVLGLLFLFIRPLKEMIITGDVLWDDYWRRKAVMNYPQLSSNNIESLVQVGVFIIILICVISLFKEKDYITLLYKTGDWCKIIVLYGIVEFVLKNVIKINTVNMIDGIFGKSSTGLLQMELRGGFYKLSGLSSESAHFAYALYVTALVFIGLNIIKGTYKIWVLFTLGLIALTMSFSSVLFIGFLIGMYILYRLLDENNKKRKILYIIELIGIVVLAVILSSTLDDTYSSSYYGSRIVDIQENLKYIFSNIDVRLIPYASSRVRMVSSIRTLKLLLKRPLLGIGINATNSHGSFSTILASIGIVGVYTWIKFLFYSKKIFAELNNKLYFVFIVMWCVMNIFVSHGLATLYSSENIVIMIAFQIICNKKNNLKIYG